MTNLDITVLGRAGFGIMAKPALDYEDEGMARSCLQWGSKAPAEVEAQAVFAMDVMGTPRGSAVLDTGCGNGVAAVKLAASQGSPTIGWLWADCYAASPGAHDAAILLDPALQVAQPELIRKLSESMRPGGCFFLRRAAGRPQRPRRSCWLAGYASLSILTSIVPESI